MPFQASLSPETTSYIFTPGKRLSEGAYAISISQTSFTNYSPTFTIHAGVGNLPSSNSSEPANSTAHVVVGPSPAFITMSIEEFNPGGTGARVMGMSTGTDAPYPLATGRMNSTVANATVGSCTGSATPSPTAAPPIPSTATPGTSQARTYDNGAQGSFGQCFGATILLFGGVLVFGSGSYF